MTTDEEAESFLNQDLSDLDFSQFKPVKLDFVEESLSVPMPADLLQIATTQAEAAGLPVSRYLAQVLRRALLQTA
jgi:predicted DNA binding CopG/RHH family protein